MSILDNFLKACGLTRVKQDQGLAQFGLPNEEPKKIVKPNIMQLGVVDSYDQETLLRAIMINRSPESDRENLGDLVWIEKTGDRYLIRSIDVKEYSPGQFSLVVDLNDTDNSRLL